MGSRTRIASTLILGSLLGPSLVGCGGDGEAADSGVKVTAKIDSQSGEIRMPKDAFDLSTAENAIFSTANSLAMSRCMQDAGVGEFFPFVDRRNPDPEQDRRYGVWVRSLVARYGYGTPPPSERRKLLLTLNTLEFTPAADKAIEACRPKLDALGLRLPTPPDDLSTSDVETVAIEDIPEAKTVIKEWVSCLKQLGVPAPESGRWAPAGINEAPLQEQIRVGLIDVDCKTKINMIQRLADIEATSQQPYVEKHEAQLVEQRKTYEEIVARSRQYIAGAPELSAT